MYTFETKSTQIGYQYDIGAEYLSCRCILNMALVFFLILNLSSHHTIVYDTVVINRGNGYNIGDGIFTAPVTGVYAFHVYVCVIQGPENPFASLEITCLWPCFRQNWNNKLRSYL